jgi:O-antigen ligase
MVLQQYPEKIKTAVKVLLVLAVLQAFYALISLAAHKTGINLGGVSAGHIESAVSLQGGFEEPNLLGAFAAAIGLIFLALLTARNSGIAAWKAGAGACLMQVVLLLTFTRAAWLGFIVGLALLVFMQKPSRNIFNPRAAAVVLVIGVALIVVALPFANAIEAGQVSKRIGDILNFSQGSAEGRVEVQNLALDAMPDAYLLGHGTLSLVANDTHAKLEGGWLYSSFIQAIHDTGLIGLMILVWFQIGVIVITARAYLKTKDNFLRAALIGFVAGSVSLIFASQASSFIWLGFPWVFAGLAVATATLSQQSGQEGDQARAA